MYRGGAMFKETLEKAINFYENYDHLIIVNKDGIAEYSTTYDYEKRYSTNDNVTGMHILEIYPELTEDTSSIIRTLKTGKENLNEEQVITHFRGQKLKLLNSDFPIIIDGEIVGAIEVSVILEDYGKEHSKNGNRYTCILDEIITQDKSFIELKEKIKMISSTDSSVLIFGETGTGKGMVAQGIHSYSNRYKKPFISQNCAAIPSTLLESTFFGTVKGAYTGAESRPGLFEIAKEGTLFLDEINSMDMGLQAKILKAIEDKKIVRVGGWEEISVNVRIVSALNVRPEVAIKDNKLREDLFYRLSVVQLNIPPLRERKKDIDLLTEYFIKKYNKIMGRNISGISDLVRDILHRYSWPGNVRELQNTIESTFNITKGNIITVQDIPQYIFDNREQEILVKERKDKFVNEIPDSIDLDKSLQEILDEFEKTLVTEAIKSSRSLSQAAKKLKISGQLLQYKISKYNLRDIIEN